MVWLLVLLMPLTLFAQISFDPVQLDDGSGEVSYYTNVWLRADGNLLCTWCSEVDESWITYGQVVSPWGELIGDPIYYDTANCATSTMFIFTPDGREGQLFHHT